MEDFKRRKAFLAITSLSVILPILGFSWGVNANDVLLENRLEASDDSRQKSNLEAGLKPKSDQYWLVDKPQTAKVWLSYSSDNAIKRVIDFGQEQVEISYRGAFLAESTPDSLRQNAEEFLQITVAEAYRLAGIPLSLSGTSLQKDRSLLNISSAQASKLYFSSKINRTKAVSGDVLTITLKLPSNSLQKRAEIIQPMVAKLAGAEQVSSALVMAIMHEENAFNFFANAPSKSRGSSTEADLEKDIKQLALLNQQFAAVEDDESRQLCVIAAYRVGVNEVVRIFTGRTSLAQALPLVNQLSSKQVRGQLRSQLRVKSGGEYVQQVSSFLALYD